MPTRVVRGKQGPDVLHLSFDRKVSPLATYQASRDDLVGIECLDDEAIAELQDKVHRDAKG